MTASRRLNILIAVEANSNHIYIFDITTQKLLKKLVGNSKS